MKKKLTALVLALAMMLGLTQGAFAANEQYAEETVFETEIGNLHISEIEGGYMCLFADDTKNVAILTDDVNKFVSSSISYAEYEGYSFKIENFDFVEFDPQSPTFWVYIIQYMEENLDKGQLIQITVDNSGSIQPYSSAEEDLMIELSSLEGATYGERTIASETYSNYTTRVTQSMAHNVSKQHLIWSITMDVASFITTIVGAAATKPNVTAVCTALGLVIAAETIINFFEADKYNCRATTTRYTYINNVSSPCNWTSHFVDYIGIDGGYGERAHILPDSRSEGYTHGKAYYNDFTSQAQDAYTYYLDFYA